MGGQATWIRLVMRESRDYGGACYGDSDFVTLDGNRRPSFAFIGLTRT